MSSVGIVLYCIVLYPCSWYCIVLYCIHTVGIVLYCIHTVGIVLYCIVLYPYSWYCIVLYCIHTVGWYCCVQTGNKENFKGLINIYKYVTQLGPSHVIYYNFTCYVLMKIIIFLEFILLVIKINYFHTFLRCRNLFNLPIIKHI